MSNRQFDKSDLDSVMEYAKKLEGLTMEEIFLRCNFIRPTKRMNLRKKDPREPIRQFVYKEERGNWHCDKKKGGCLERETSEWYKKILDGDGKFLTKKELKIILNRSGERLCRKCHNGEYYPVKVGGKCRICGESIQGNKGAPGNLVDCYFGYERKTDSEPDLVEVGVELKARPLVGNAKQTSIKEPMSMNLIDWNKDFKSEGDITKSSWYNKCSKMLLFYWEHTDSMFWEWKMKDVFLWKVDKKGIKDFEQDYRNIVVQMRNGVRCTDKSGKQVNNCKDKNSRNYPCKTGLHQGLNKYLTTCPKHGGKPPYRKDKTEKNSVLQPKRDYGRAEIKAFRIKTGYELKILEMYRKNRPENGILVY